MKSKIITLLVSGVCGLASLQAQAAPTPSPTPTTGYCQQSPLQTWGLSVNDMTLTNASNVVVSATDCYGVVSGTDAGGNGGNVALSFVNSLNWGTVDFSAIGKVDVNGSTATASLFGLTFSISTTGINSTTGSWLLTIVDQNESLAPNLPVALDLVAALKGSRGAALYAWDDIVVDGSNPGGFAMKFNASSANGGFAELSNLSLFVREGGGNVIIEVPEPATLALLGLGLVGLGVARRRSA